MSALKAPSCGVLLLIFCISCQAVNKSKSSGTSDFVRSVSYLSPELIENQLSPESSYNGQIVITVENNEVVEELRQIQEIREVTEISFLKSNNSFESVVYVVHFKKGINPIPYYNFFNEFNGVVAAEFDGVIGHCLSTQDVYRK
jgi:hypothetical protein